MFVRILHTSRAHGQALSIWPLSASVIRHSQHPCRRILLLWRSIFCSKLQTASCWRILRGLCVLPRKKSARRHLSDGWDGREFIELRSLSLCSPQPPNSDADYQLKNQSLARRGNRRLGFIKTLRFTNSGRWTFTGTSFVQQERRGHMLLNVAYMRYNESEWRFLSFFCYSTLVNCYYKPVDAFREPQATQD